MAKDSFRAFVAGSSILAVAITFTYVGGAYLKNDRPKDFPYPWFALIVPVLFGLWNIVLNRIPSHSSSGYTKKMILGGAVFGLLLSFLGSVVLDVPKKLNAFGWPKKKWIPLATAWALYAVIWGVIVNLINRGTGVAKF